MKTNRTTSRLRDTGIAAVLTTLAFCPSLLVAKASPDESAPATATSSSDHSSSSLKWSDRHFVNKVAENNDKEMAFARLATQQGNNPQVRSYAQRLLTDHGTMDQELLQLAQQKDVKLEHTNGSAMSSNSTAATSGSAAASMRDGTYDRTSTPDNTGGTVANPSLGFMGNHEYRKLSSQSGQTFDRDFIDKMVDEHEGTIKIFEKKAQDADDPEVKAFAEKYLPSLREHLQEAQNLQKTLG